MLAEKARVFGKNLGIDNDFSYSSGWLYRFKRRHNISQFVAHGEAASADMANVIQGRAQLQEELADYEADDIYNLDETGLFYRLEPNATLATSSVRGKKRSKERITVALCSNASGTDKIKPLVIGKSARPRCFGKTYDPNVYVTFYNNPKSWMTSAIFQDWMLSFDRRMKLQRRHVVLLVDNAASHSIGGLKLTNVKLKFLPPNTTAHVQPMDAGIIRNFKGNYKRHLVSYFLDCIEKREEQKVTIRQAITFLKEAWHEVKQTTIVNCWRHTRILPSTESSDDTDGDPDENVPLAQLRQLLTRFPSENDTPVMNAADYLAIDDSIETGETLSDDAIVELVSDSQSVSPTDENQNSGSDSDDEPLTVSHAVAKKGLTDAIKHFEQHPSLGQGHIENLWKAVRSLETCAGIKQTSIANFFKLKCDD